MNLSGNLKLEKILESIKIENPKMKGFVDVRNLRFSHSYIGDFELLVSWTNQFAYLERYYFIAPY